MTKTWLSNSGTGGRIVTTLEIYLTGFAIAFSIFIVVCVFWG